MHKQRNEMQKENCRPQLCRCCLQEIPNLFASTYLLQKPEQDIQLVGQNLAKSYLDCYYYCISRQCSKSPPKESLNDYGRICLKCKGILVEATKFIVSSKLNEAFLLSMLDNKSELVINAPTQNKLSDDELEEDLDSEMIEEYLDSSEYESCTYKDDEKDLDSQTNANINSASLNDQTTYSKDDCNSLENFEEIVLEAANNDNCVLEETTLLGSDQQNVSKLEEYMCFNCVLCTKVFNLESQLYEHYNCEHDQKTFGFPCDICKQRYVSFKALRYHRHRDHKSYKYIDCKICGKAVVAKFYKRHKDQHVFKCDKCDEKYNSKYELHKHNRMSHDLVREKRYDCQECSRHFFSSTNLKLHSITHQNNISSSNQGYVFSCDLCSQSFLRPIHLKHHLDSHRRGIMKCAQCNKEFTRLTDMETHLSLHVKKTQKIEHEEQTSGHNVRYKSINYQCPFCQKVFDTVFNLRHHSYVHSGWPLTCNLCNAGYSSVYLMRRHLKDVHCKQFKNRYFAEIADTLYERHRIKEIFPRAMNIL